MGGRELKKPATRPGQAPKLGAWDNGALAIKKLLKIIIRINLHDKLARIGACEGGALLVPISRDMRQLVLFKDTKDVACDGGALAAC